MQNKLPEKLTLLRKQSQYSQGDVAGKLNVPVTEYMNWENGNAICSISQLKQLADLYRVALDDLVDNTKTVIIPTGLENSVTIPFMNGQSINQTQTMDAADNILPVDGALPAASGDTIQASTIEDESLGRTKVMNSSSIKDEMDEKPSAKKPSAKNAKDKKKKQTIIIIAGAVAAIVVIAVAIFLLNGFGLCSSLSISSKNRLAVGDTYSLYIDKNGKLNEYGSFNPTKDFEAAVQVSAYEDHAVELLKDGTVISSDGDSTVASWTKITSVAAGKNHTAAIDKDGKVYCSGSTSACKVDGWTNITSIYAGNEVTIGITGDGNVKLSGDNAGSASNQSNVKSVALSSTNIAVLKKDGTVSNYLVGSGTLLDTSSWAKIESIACGDNLIAGLASDGTVKVATADTSITDVTSTWKNIRYLEACNGTIVAFDESGNMYGAGDNSHGQYTVTNPSASASADALAVPQNIKVEETTANISIKWDTVEHADYYEVAMDSSPATSTKTTSNSTSIPTSSLVDGSTYKITVTAKANDSTKYADGVGTLEYTYSAKKVQLDTPSGITGKTSKSGWVIQWSSVSHADTYGISLDGNPEVTVTDNTYTYASNETEITSGDHVIKVTAYSSTAQYSQSETGSATLTYTPTTFDVKIHYTMNGADAFTAYATLGIGSYTFDAIDKVSTDTASSHGYTLSDPNGTVYIQSTTTDINIEVVNN